MKTWVALLRGINVGGRGKLPMKDLARILEDLGCREVETYIQSGNVVLRSAENAGPLARKITARISEEHGFAPHVLLIEAGRFRKAASSNPYPQAEDDPKSVHLGFLDSKPRTPDLEGLEELRAKGEEFTLEGQTFYLLAPAGIGRSKLASRCERLLGVPTTLRNWNTVAKLVSMLDSR